MDVFMADSVVVGFIFLLLPRSGSYEELVARQFKTLQDVLLSRWFARIAEMELYHAVSSYELCGVVGGSGF